MFGFPSPPAELGFLETVDEVEVLRLRGIPAELHILDIVDEIKIRNSKSTKLSTKSKF